MVCPNFRSSIWCNSRSKEQLTVWSRMGVIASKKTKERTKQVQQTAAVVTALKSTSTKSNKVEPQPNKTSSKSTHVGYGGRRLSDEREGLNNCKDSLTYGLPELKDSDTAYNMSASGDHWLLGSGEWEARAVSRRLYLILAPGMIGWVRHIPVIVTTTISVITRLLICVASFGMDNCYEDIHVYYADQAI